MENKIKANDTAGGFLETTPKIEGVSGFLHHPVIERWIGRRDGKRKQVCRLGDGYTTPWVSNRERFYNSFVDRTYSRVISLEEPDIKAVYRMIVEMDERIASLGESTDVSGDGEEAARQRRRMANAKARGRSRILEIMMELASTESYLRVIDEKLDHFIEAAGNVLYAHVSTYWSGVRSTCREPVSHYPEIEKRRYPGREKYETNRDQVIEAIQIAIKKGNELYEEEKQ